MARPLRSQPARGVSPSVGASTDDELARRYDVKHVLEKLDSRERLAVYCRFFEGLTLDQTAKRLGTSKSTAYRIVADALQKLMRALAAYRDP